MDGEALGISDDVKPNPDPTIATYDALTRSARGERDYVLSQTVNRTPTMVQTEIVHLRDRVDLLMDGVDRRFADGAAAREREQRDNKVAVDAAFAAQKEAAAKQDESNSKAIDKSEAATAETIATNAALFRSSIAALEGQLADMKDRLIRAEGLRAGGKESLAGIYALVGVIATVLSIGGILLAVLGK
jgi:hypothetical protein